jgi:predicted TIM-barrel fold metal-dependent hydrolase
MKIIDPHIHLFNLEQGDYHWLKSDNSPFWPDKSAINKSFTESDLTLLPPLELAGFVHIEAGFDNSQPWRELEALEQSCNKPFQAIANIDLTASRHDFSQCLIKLAELRSFVGVRHILDEQALSLLSNKQVVNNLKVLNNYNYNAHVKLVFEAQLTLTDHASVNVLCDVINENPNINFIINHAGFPPACNHVKTRKLWQSNLLKIATHSNTAIKCSGWELTDRNYQAPWLNESLSVIFKVFGTKRMMLASNFPLCLLSKKAYQDYWALIISSDFVQALTKQEINALCYDNALYYYLLKQ